MRAWIVSGAALVLAASSLAAAAPTLLHVSSHLPKAAKVSLDGAAPVRAPGYGSTVIPVTAGHHVLKVTTATGVTYQQPLDLTAGQLFKWKGKGYWCVNLMERSFEVYSAENCNEDVADAG
jgi:hypothetical protein